MLFGPRDMRLYPNGTLAAHVMGGASYGKEGVHAAEVIGVAGVEKFFRRLPARSGQWEQAASNCRWILRCRRRQSGCWLVACSS